MTNKAKEIKMKANPDGHYQFKFPLLQNWWKLSRGL